MKITRELLRKWNACYSDAQIAELVPESGLTPMEVADMDRVPVADRIWVLLRHEVLGEALVMVVDQIAEDAIRCVVGRSGVPEWEEWAQAWLAGDRAYAAASAAAYAADAAYAAAWVAASAAAYAAHAAASAAVYAVASAAAHAADAAYAAAWAAAKDAARDARDAARDAMDTARQSQLAHIRAALVEVAGE